MAKLAIAVFALALIVLGSGGHALAQTPTPPQTVTYAAGWNLVAFPAGTSLAGIQGSLYTWQPGDTSYEIVQPSQGAKNGLGYWVYFPSKTTVTLAAGSNATMQVTLPAGQWAMLGDPSGTEFASIQGMDAAYTYNPAGGYSANVSCGLPVPGVVCAQLGPGDGVWVYSAAGATISIALHPFPL